MKTSIAKLQKKYRKDWPFFIPSIQPGGTNIKDIQTGVTSISSISGTRYGIVNGVITQFAVDQPAIEDNGLRGCPAFTQSTITTETLSSWSKTNVSVTSTETYQGSALHTITETIATGVHGIPYPSIAVSDNSIIGFRCLLGNRGRNFQAKAQRKSGYVSLCKVDTATGVISGIHASVVAYSIQAIPNTSLFAFFIACNVGAGADNVRIFPELLNGTTESYTGDGLSGIHFAQPVFINYGVSGVSFIPPYVPNNTTGAISVVSETATSTLGTSFDLDDAKLMALKTALRGPNAQGHLEMLFKSNVSSADLPLSSEFNIFSCANATAIGLRYRKYSDGTTVWGIVDGNSTTCNAPASTLSMGQAVKLIMDWGYHPSGGLKMRLIVNGVQSTLATFSGSFGTQDLRFFFGNTIHAGWIVKDSFFISERPQW